MPRVYALDDIDKGVPELIWIMRKRKWVVKSSAIACSPDNSPVERRGGPLRKKGGADGYDPHLPFVTRFAAFSEVFSRRFIWLAWNLSVIGEAARPNFTWQ